MTDWNARLPQISELLAGADHVDVKTECSSVGLREFVAAMMAYEPGWVRVLFRLRKHFVRLIGLRQDGVPTAPRWTPAQVPMLAGERASFFTVRKAVEGAVWAADVEERHLRAQLCVVAEGGQFCVVTIVHYKHWTGRLYFNVIRPFHHFVVSGMAHAGARGLPRLSHVT
jgi:hypothetical protein